MLSALIGLALDYAPKWLLALIARVLRPLRARMLDRLSGEISVGTMMRGDALFIPAVNRAQPPIQFCIRLDSKSALPVQVKLVRVWVIMDGAHLGKIQWDEHDRQFLEGRMSLNWALWGDVTDLEPKGTSTLRFAFAPPLNAYFVNVIQQAYWRLELEGYLLLECSLGELCVDVSLKTWLSDYYRDRPHEVQNMLNDIRAYNTIFQSHAH